MAFVCLMTMVTSVNAQDDIYGYSHKKKNTKIEYNVSGATQNGWIISKQNADELMGVQEHTLLLYVNNGCSFGFADTDDTRIYIGCDKGIFDTEVTKWAFQYKSLFEAVVGYYDEANKLIEKKKCLFEVKKDVTTAVSIADNWGKKEAKNIIPYLINKRGYVRIVAPLRNGKCDITIPCMNNN